MEAGPRRLAVALSALLLTADAHQSGNEGYLDGYAYIGIHEEMLKDSLRTNAYRDAILKNKDIFADAIVVDIGCGTGILSLFAAEAGAKQVYCIEASSLASTAQEIITVNGMGDKIEVLNMLAEDVKLPGGCDVIVSEWMGYFLLYENMLDPVLEFRDKWLRQDGIIFPSSVTLMAGLYSDPDLWAQRVEFWDNVEGFDFSPLKDMVIEEQFKWPERQHLDRRGMISTSQVVKSIDVYEATRETLKSIRSEIYLTSRRDCNAHGISFWFEAIFEGIHTEVLDTSPTPGYNHWSQVIWYFDTPLQIKRGEAISAYLSMETTGSGAFDVEFYATKPAVIYKSAQGQNPDTIYQNLYERMVWERHFVATHLMMGKEGRKGAEGLGYGMARGFDHFTAIYEEVLKEVSKGISEGVYGVILLSLFLFGSATGRCYLVRTVKRKAS